MKTIAAANIVPLCLLVAVAGVPASAGETETSYSVRLVAGYDTNPLQVSKYGSAPSGAFSQLRLHGGVSGHTSPTVSLFASGQAGTRVDESLTSDAGYDSGAMRAGVSFLPRFAGQRMVFSLGGRYAIYRGTFTDNETGVVYEANAVPPNLPPTTIPIPERLNYDSAGAFLKLRWKQNRRFSLSLNSRFDRTDYVNDYAELTDLSPLDYRSVRVQPGASFRFSKAVSLGLSVVLTDLDYDDRLALDANGDEVSGTTRSYRYVNYQLAVSVRPADRWSLRVGLAGGGRDDTYAGYYDYANASAFLAVDHEFGLKSRLHVYASIFDTDYESATVSGDPAADVLGSSEQLYMARFDRSLGKRTRWFVEGGTRQRDNQNPVFTFDRDWFLTGIHFGR